MDRKLKICLVGAKFKGEDSKSLKFIADGAQALGIELTNLEKGKLYSKLVDNKLEFYCDDLNIEEQDAFIFRGISKMIDPVTGEHVSVYRQMCLFAHYLKNTLGKVVVEELLAGPNITFTKYTTAAKLSAVRLSNIPTWMFLKKYEVIKHADELPYPIIVKPVDGARGNGVFKFNNKEELIRHLNENHPSTLFYPNMIQQCIENDGDYRVVVVGGKVVAALKKNRGEDSIVANMSKGNEAVAVIPDKELEEMAIKAAETLGMEFAGVDIIEDVNTKKRYILEVNLGPQIYFTSIYSGINVGEELIRYVIEKVNKSRGN